jgi:hypothetical protein
MTTVQRYWLTERCPLVFDRFYTPPSCDSAHQSDYSQIERTLAVWHRHSAPMLSIVVAEPQGVRVV